MNTCHHSDAIKKSSSQHTVTHSDIHILLAFIAFNPSPGRGRLHQSTSLHESLAKKCGKFRLEIRGPETPESHKRRRQHPTKEGRLKFFSHSTSPIVLNICGESLWKQLYSSISHCWVAVSDFFATLMRICRQHLMTTSFFQDLKVHDYTQLQHST